MTERQKMAVKRIRFMLDSEVEHAGNKYEIKEFEVNEEFVNSSGFVFLYVEWGLKGDEGTLASAFCREKVHISIGKRGGVQYITNKVRGGIKFTTLKLFPYAQGPLASAANKTYLARQRHYHWMDKQDKKRGA